MSMPKPPHYFTRSQPPFLSSMFVDVASLELLHGLPKEMIKRLEKEQNQPLPAVK